MNTRNLLTIGEFSKVTGLTVKTLRFYQEQGLLSPTVIDEETGYRYYGEQKIEVAAIIVALRKLDFPLAEIAGILHSCAEDADLLDALEAHKKSIQVRMRQDREVAKRLDEIISAQREAKTIMNQPTFDVQEKTLEPLLVAGIRIKGKYSDCGRGFGRIGKRFGRQICGKTLMLHYDTEYKEDAADFEACLPIRNGQSADGISVRELPGGKCVSLLHAGPYDELGRSYAKVFKHVNDRGYQVQMPTREVYLKGPGMVFKGNPKKYLTEIQVVIS